MKAGKIFALTLALAGLALASAACSKLGKTPTGTAKAIYDSIKSKDVATLKKALSKDTLSAFEQAAGRQNKNADDLLKEAFFAKTPSVDFEARNEKLTDNMGTVELKGEGGRWQTFHFVKEDNLWKWDAIMTLRQGGFAEGDEGGGGGNQGGGTQGGGGHDGH